jgi:hypothetical protein
VQGLLLITFATVGSGLILLVIVGAWLAVLVPMALRSHDTTTSLSSVDRFSDAMRVLSRRDALARLRERAVEVPEHEPDLEELLELERAHRPGPSLAQRRRRVLLALVTLAVSALAGGLLGPAWLLGAAGGFAALAVAYVVHLRRQAVLKEQRAARRAAPARRPAQRPAPRPVQPHRGVRIAGIPDRLPARPAPLDVPLPAGAKRYDEPVPVPAAVGGAWAPVPVPVPTYVTAPAAPARPPTVLDLTKPGRYSEALREAEQRLGIRDDGPALDDILERRRAVNDW